MSIAAVNRETRRHSEQEQVAETLRHLPARRVDAETDNREVSCDRVDPDAYRLRRGERTIGYIDVVGAVFVAHLGARRDHAEELVQTLIFEAAVASLVRADEARA